MKRLKHAWQALLGRDGEVEQVRELHLKFGFLQHRRPGHLTQQRLLERLDCMAEELLEFRQAIDQQDLEGQADALVDLVYFAKGTAAMLGLPWRDLWDDVHRANMSKERGVTKRGHAYDIIKPTGWQPPQTGWILYDHGYRRVHWTIRKIPHSRVAEEKCRDYRP